MQFQGGGDEDYRDTQSYIDTHAEAEAEADTQNMQGSTTDHLLVHSQHSCECGKGCLK